MATLAELLNDSHNAYAELRVHDAACEDFLNGQWCDMRLELEAKAKGAKLVLLERLLQD